KPRPGTRGWRGRAAVGVRRRAGYRIPEPWRHGKFWKPRPVLHARPRGALMKSPRRTELSHALQRFRMTFYCLAAFSCVINVLALAPSIYMLQVYDRVLASGNETTLLMLTILVLALFLLSGLLEFIRSTVLIRIGNRF